MRFLPLKEKLRGRKFTADFEVISAVEFFKSASRKRVFTCFEKWNEQWDYISPKVRLVWVVGKSLNNYSRVLGLRRKCLPWRSF